MSHSPLLRFNTDHLLSQVEGLMAELCHAEGHDILGEVALDHLQSGGKRLRARLALAVAEALGANPEDAVGWAAACEILHNATLIHDDIQDGDKMRRGKPTMWVKHGLPHAINAGDLLFMLPIAAIGQVETSDALRWQLSEVLARHASAVIRGQGAEYVMTEAMDAKRPVYEAAVTGKTSALFEMPVEGAALLAGRSKESAQQIAAIFRHMGILFQLQDDVLDLYGEKGRANPGGDLYEGKVSAFVVEYLDDSQNDSELLVQLLKTPRENISQREVDAMIVVFREKGVLDRVLSWLDSYAQSVRSNPSLEKEPALRELAETLLKVVLHPIEHVRAVV